MSNLIPEKRLDKTGKLVTRHVRANNAGGLMVSGVPAPKVASAGAPSGLPVSEDEVSDAIRCGIRRFVNYKPVISDNLRTLAQHSPDALREVHENMKTCSDYRAALWGMLLMANFGTVKGTAAYGKTLMTHAAVMDIIAELDPDARRNAIIGRTDTFRAGEIWEKASLLIKGCPGITARTFKAAAFAIWATKYDTPLKFDTHGDDISFIAENLDSVMQHRDAIRSRRTIDRGFIESIINIESSLSEGTL